MAYGGGYGGGGNGYGQSNPYGSNNNGYGGPRYGDTGGYSNNSGYSNNQGGYSAGGGYGGGGNGYSAGGAQGGYGSNNYGQQTNPYDDNEDSPSAPQNGYGNDQYNNAPGGGGGLPSRPMPSSGGMNSDILEQCSAIDQTITEVEGRLQAFKALQSRILSDRANITDLDGSSSELMSTYRNLAARMKRIKQNQESGTPRNAPQVGRVDRRLKTAITDFQKLESDFRAQMKDQQARQYRIVNPTASEQEVREAVEDPNTQIFQQALLNSDRRGQAQTTLNAVRQRHEAIQNIERTMIELAELFQDLDTLVMEQEVAVKQIEEKGIEVQENIVKANEELDGGIKSARGARKKKWICLCLVVLLLIIIAIAVTVYVLMQKKINPLAPKSDPTPRTVTATATAVAATPAPPLPATTRA